MDAITIPLYTSQLNAWILGKQRRRVDESQVFRIVVGNLWPSIPLFCSPWSLRTIGFMPIAHLCLITLSEQRNKQTKNFNTSPQKDFKEMLIGSTCGPNRHPNQLFCLKPRPLCRSTLQTFGICHSSQLLELKS